MGRRTTVLGLAAVTVLAAACGGSSQPGGTIDDGAPGDDAPVGAWELREADPPIDVPPEARITLTVAEDGDRLQAGGTAACNSYGGVLQAAGGSWELEALSWTEMGCDEPRMTAEAAYLDALQRIDAWARDGDTLRLTGAGVTLTFAELPEVEPSALTGTTWVLDGTISGSGDDAAVSSVATGVDPAELRLDEDGTFTLFSGCRDFAGEWTTSGDEVLFPSWGQTEDARGVAPDGGLDCGDAAAEQERAVLEVVEGGFVPEVDGDRLTLRQGAAGLVLRAR